MVPGGWGSRGFLGENDVFLVFFGEVLVEIYPEKSIDIEVVSLF